MASTDNGGQIITFRYQQEGTAEGFNKLLQGVLPRGIISGGELRKENDTTVAISPLQMMIGDDNVIVHVETTTDAIVGVSNSSPFVIAKFNWANLTNNYVSFESSAYNSLPTTHNTLILGKCEFVGANFTTFDYTRKTWSSSYYNNAFLFDNEYRTKSPSFNVTPVESAQPSLAFNVGIGKAIIHGKEIELPETSITLNTSDTSSPVYFNDNVQHSRTDIAIITDNGTIEYIMGEDSLTPMMPICPAYALPIAKFSFGSGIGINQIKGSNITYIFNNNYLATSPTVGKIEGSHTINSHTLYL